MGEALNVLKGRVQVYVEIKPSRRDGVYGRYPDVAEAVAAEIRRAGMLDKALVISFDWHILPLVKAFEPSLPTGALISDDVWDARLPRAIPSLVERVSELGCQWINMDSALFSDEMPEIVHQNGLKLGVWTVNSLSAMRHFAAAGADSLTSDRPDLFAELAT
jgi:glycerophosphoryl diester phosphodiesterase